MGQATVFTVIGAMLIGLFVLFNLQRDTSDADEALADHQVKVLVREVAHTGLSRAVYTLADSPGMGSWTALYGESISGGYENGAYTATFVDPGIAESEGDLVDVEVTAAHGGAEHRIFARYERDQSDVGVPPAFRNAIVTDNFLQLRGNVRIRAISDSLNASIHTNGDLSTDGNSFRVDGYGTHTGSENTREENFQPNIDYNGSDPNVFWADSVHIPPIDLEKLRDEATLVSTGNQAMSGETVHFENWAGELGKTAGTEDNPFIWVVEGDLSLEDMHFAGYGMVVTVGDLETRGTIIGGIDDNYETMVGLFAAENPDTGFGGNIDIRGNDDIRATFYADGRVTMYGTPDLVGGIVAPETYFEGRGDMNVTYASPSETIIDPGFEYIIPIGPILIAFSEW